MSPAICRSHIWIGVASYKRHRAAPAAYNRGNNKMWQTHSALLKLSRVSRMIRGTVKQIIVAWKSMIIDEHPILRAFARAFFIRPKRAVYGAANIPAMVAETVLRNIPNVSHSLRLNQVKYTFALLSVEFLGHKINGAGVYDHSLPLVLATDTSKIGLDTALSHRLSYKEVLAIIWTYKKLSNFQFAEQIAKKTRKTPDLSKIRSWKQAETFYGQVTKPHGKPTLTAKSVIQTRVVILAALQPAILNNLHTIHPKRPWERVYIDYTRPIAHKLTTPYYPSTTNQAERYVQTIKNALNMSTTQRSIQQNINRFL
ncbi:hypothetical protein ALC53_04453 [Atta colombica]|uniref:Uncharacterized protein n=1 Tax=Atta colombica TaxID=520822 RepID=A0A195BLJ2_9HYME|nr:hypothetical protein ALC53_04453 [Atta colombica]